MGGDARCTGPAPAAVGGGRQPAKQKVGSETTSAPVVVPGGGGVGGGVANKVESVRNNNLVDISLLNHANRGVEALGVLVQYLVFNVSTTSFMYLSRKPELQVKFLNLNFKFVS